MKKSLIIGIVLSLLVFFVSCKPETTQKEEEKILVPVTVSDIQGQTKTFKMADNTYNADGTPNEEYMLLTPMFAGLSEKTLTKGKSYQSYLHGHKGTIQMTKEKDFYIFEGFS